jgi:stage V sporulation protein AD
MLRGELRRILVVATGALLSPLSYQQGETIPCIAHAVALEMPAAGSAKGGTV